MRIRLIIGAGALLVVLQSQAVLAQSAPGSQATSPGQVRPGASANTLPQSPSGGQSTGAPAAGQESAAQRDAEDQAKRSTQICKGC